MSAAWGGPAAAVLQPSPLTFCATLSLVAVIWTNCADRVFWTAVRGILNYFGLYQWRALSRRGLYVRKQYRQVLQLVGGTTWKRSLARRRGLKGWRGCSVT
ncbi:uncharacterized protein PpBr36_06225 [Pyricularia pennisetigena]|uniref:uncharacterized protein n=1 Tax=Pyricularia pennisetigena TaxID=1578925 RepID=UPI0011535D93|nr:uncharacterized protein PpBr36_06225 [Pyricularia pennisetigena]TLS22801.1 hypothetical protein PpBr36_06225 [Pyricularia pennisetigena]